MGSQRIRHNWVTFTFTTHFKPSLVMSLKISSIKASLCPWSCKQKDMLTDRGQDDRGELLEPRVGNSISAPPLDSRKRVVLSDSRSDKSCLMEPSFPRISKHMSYIQRTSFLTCVLLNLFKLSFCSSLKFLCTQVCQDFSLWLLCHMFYIFIWYLYTFCFYM